MAGLIGCKVWYVTEKGELEVSQFDERRIERLVVCVDGCWDTYAFMWKDPSIHALPYL